MSAFYEYFLYSAFGLFVIGFAIAALWDTWRFIIPNWLVIAVTGLFFVTGSQLDKLAVLPDVGFGSLTMRIGTHGASPGR